MDKIGQTLEARGCAYGRFDEMAELAQRLKSMLREADRWDTLAPDQREALEMVMLKVARIVVGDPRNRDSWHDIAGYAELVGRSIGVGYL